jgi:hypothetical protein
VTARLRTFIHRAWIPLALLVVVAALTAVTSQISARSDEAAGEAQAAEPDAQRRGGGGQRAGDRDATANLRTCPWWLRDEDVKRELGLSDEKAAAILGICEDRAARMGPFAAERVAEEAVLDQMFRERVVSPEAFEMQALKVESINAQLRQTRWAMLYRSYRELEPQQYEKLLEISERRRGRGSSGTNR